MTDEQKLMFAGKELEVRGRGRVGVGSGGAGVVVGGGGSGWRKPYASTCSYVAAMALTWQLTMPATHGQYCRPTGRPHGVGPSPSPGDVCRGRLDAGHAPQSGPERTQRHYRSLVFPLPFYANQDTAFRPLFPLLVACVPTALFAAENRAFARGAAALRPAAVGVQRALDPQRSGGPSATKVARITSGCGYCAFPVIKWPESPRIADR